MKKARPEMWSREWATAEAKKVAKQPDVGGCVYVSQLPGGKFTMSIGRQVTAGEIRSISKFNPAFTETVIEVFKDAERRSLEDEDELAQFRALCRGYRERQAGQSG